MKTIQMTLDAELIVAVDKVAKLLQLSRSAFARQALRDALMRYEVEIMERKHREGYKRYPVNEDEFSAWEDEQAWGD